MIANIHQKLSIIICTLLLTISFPVVSNNKVDLVIFSYDRPLQLYALLESTERFVSGLDTIHVIYRISAPEYEAAYDQVRQAFPTVFMNRQGNNPHSDFKSLTLEAVFISPNNYVIFAVDDIIVTGPIDLAVCTAALETHNAYGFYFRLGRNTTRCYTLNVHQGVPPLEDIEPNIQAWWFNDGHADWSYPNTLDFVMYRKCDIEHNFMSLNYENPNTLELHWSYTAKNGPVCERRGLCYEHSKIVNIPLNRVGWVNSKNMNFASASQFLKMFNDGLKIDINPLFEINNTAAHMEYCPTFIPR